MEPGPNELIELWLQGLKEAASAEVELARDKAAATRHDWERLAVSANKKAESAAAKLFADHFVPAVRRAVSARFAPSSADFEDICQQALTRLSNRLDQLRAQADSNGASLMVRTANWRAYAQRVAFNCVFEHIRKHSRSWRSVSGRLHYLFAKRPDLEIWQADGREICGRIEWRGRPAAELQRGNPRLADITADASRPWPEIVDLVLAEAEAPIRFDDLVRLLHRHSLPEMEQQESRSREEDDHSRAWEGLPDGAESSETHAYLREVTARMWKIIQTMPVGYRRALLLNLKGVDGGDIQLVDYLKLASPADLAASLGMDAELFEELWPKLPLDDNAIAQRFGVTRQQVINWRSTARERLRHDLEDWHGAI